LFGLKAIAIAIALGTAVISIAMWAISSSALHAGIREAWAAFTSDRALVGFVCFDVAWAIVWTVFITRTFVYGAALEYAEALLKTLDAPAMSVP
jgi:hypothetical protein